MPVSTSEIVLFKASVNTDSNNNGGRESYTQVTDNTLYNVFPRVTNAERVAGLTRYRKIFVHNIDDEQDTLYNVAFFIDKLSTGDDYFRIATGTATDTQNDIDSSYKFYGTGRLNTAASAGATSIEVNFFQTDLNGVLASGDKLYITNLKDESDTTHHSEFNEIDSISWSGSVATITLVDQLQHDYPVSYTDGGETIYTRIAVYLDLGDLHAYTDSVVATTAGDGDFDDANHPITGDNKGSVRDTITLTFTSATAFDASGSYLGSLGSGTTSSDFSPSNPNTSTPYFTVPSAGWMGTWASGDTLVFELYPASEAIWMKEVVPAGANSKANNTVVVGIYGESA